MIVSSPPPPIDYVLHADDLKCVYFFMCVCVCVCVCAVSYTHLDVYKRQQ